MSTTNVDEIGQVLMDAYDSPEGRAYFQAERELWAERTRRAREAEKLRNDAIALDRSALTVTPAALFVCAGTCACVYTG